MTNTALRNQTGLLIDTDKHLIHMGSRVIKLYSPEGFRILSDLWLKVGWDQKHPYSFTWLGRPIIQIPEDIVRIQEVIYSVKPDVIIETGVAHGGSLMLYASLMKAMGKGRVIGVDIDIRPHNRNAIEAHELSDIIFLVEGDSTSQETLTRVKKLLKHSETALVVLDSCHDYQHVLRELKGYSEFVSIGSYVVVTDGLQASLNSVPRAKTDYPKSATWPENNPKRAAHDFVKESSRFEIVEPAFAFNEGSINFRITHWPSAFLRRIK